MSALWLVIWGLAGAQEAGDPSSSGEVAEQVEASPEGLLAEALAGLTEGRPEAVVPRLLERLDHAPDDVAAMLLLAWAYNDLGLADRALAWLFEAELRGADGVVWRRERGVARVVSGAYEAGLRELLPAAQTDGRALLFRARAYEALDQRGYALADLARAQEDVRVARAAAAELKRLRSTPELLPDRLDVAAEVGFGFEQNPRLGPDFSGVDVADGYFRAAVAAAWRFQQDETGHVALRAAADVQSYFVSTTLTPVGVEVGVEVAVQRAAAERWSLSPGVRLQVYQGAPLYTELALPVQRVLRRAGHTEVLDVQVRGLVHHGSAAIVPRYERLSGVWLRGGYGAWWAAGPVRVFTGGHLELALTTGASRQHVQPVARLELVGQAAPELELFLSWQSYGRFHFQVDQADSFGRTRLEWGNLASAGARWQVVPGHWLVGGYALAQRLSNVPALYSYDRHTIDVRWVVRM